MVEDEQARSSEAERESRKRKRSNRRRSSPSESGSSLEASSSASSSSSDSEVSERHERHKKRHKKRETEERERRQRREKKRKLKEEKRKEEKKKIKKMKKKKERSEQGPTRSWGKYGLIKESDMWSKRPEFSAWLAEVKKINLENLSNREEKQIFKEYMEDYNTATFPSKKYYNIDKYFRRKMIKKMEKGAKLLFSSERTEFNDEEQRRQEIRLQREHQKEAEVHVLKRSMMGTGMAQAMKEQAQLREEMQYQFRLGNIEAANAIQRRLIPDSVLAKQQQE